MRELFLLFMRASAYTKHGVDFNLDVLQTVALSTASLATSWCLCPLPPSHLSPRLHVRRHTMPRVTPGSIDYDSAWEERRVHEEVTQE